MSFEPTLGPGTFILDKDAEFGPDCRVGANSVLGQSPLRSPSSTRIPPPQPRLIVGSRCVIGSNVVISKGNRIGDDVLIADHVSMREGNRIGDGTIIGKAVNMEYDNVIGPRVKIMNACHLTGNMVIEEGVFLGPMVCSSNDTYMDIPERNTGLKGPIIRKFARIGCNATLLPGVEIGEYAIVGAGAVVTKDVKPHTLVVGNPARFVRLAKEWYPLKVPA